MKINAIHGKILALLKHYYLKRPEDDRYVMRFFSGRRGAYPPGIGLEWWTDSLGFTLRDELARMAIASEPSLRGGDVKSFASTIQSFLQEHALDRSPFNTGALFGQASTLFDARGPENQRDFATAMWEKLRSTLAESIVTWLVFYPLNRVRSDSFALGFDGLHVMRPDDHSAWEQICARYPEAHAWDPMSGERRGMQSTPLSGTPASAWLVGEIQGTQEGSKTVAAQRMKTFLAVAFAHLYEEGSNLLTRSMGPERTMCGQIPDDAGRAQCGQSFSSIGLLQHPMLVDVTLTPELTEQFKRWYAARAAAGDEPRQRATAASHFVHYGIIADDLERFLHFFIALDALFGVRGDVERTITDGVANTFDRDSSWRDRAAELFNLRSELVHGASSHIDEWERLDHYRRHFRSHPLRDVTKASLTALRRFFDLTSGDVR